MEKLETKTSLETFDVRTINIGQPDLVQFMQYAHFVQRGIKNIGEVLDQSCNLGVFRELYGNPFNDSPITYKAPLFAVS